MTVHTLRALALPVVLVASLAALQGCGMRNTYRPPTDGGGGGGGGGSARLDVVNNSSQSVYSINASSCSDSNWGPDRLGSDVIPSGSSMSFDLTAGCWDFRADFDSNHSSGNELTQRNIQIGSGSSWTWTIGG